MESSSAPSGRGSARRLPRLLPVPFTVALATPLLGALLLGGCNLSSGKDTSSQGTAGTAREKPDEDGSFYLVDQNEGGGASRLRIEEAFWGRLVDVHGLADAATGEVDPNPVFEDFVINEAFQAHGVNFVMEMNPVTLKVKLIIKREYIDPLEPDQLLAPFLELLALTQTALAPIDPKHDDGSSAEPFSYVARNAVAVIRVNDLLDDSADAEYNLIETVRVVTGYTPATPFASRLCFDPNHGGVSGGRFHSTRILVDMTITETEAAGMSRPQSVNAVGLPESLTTTGQPNLSIRIPSREYPGTGQYEILRSVSGKAMSTGNNGPVDWTSNTLDIVRAMRAGNFEDTSNGFLIDDEAPTVIGGWKTSVDTANDDPSGDVGYDFVLDLTLPTICRAAPKVGDILSCAGGYFLEVSEPGSEPNGVTGEVKSVRARTVINEEITNPFVLLGQAIYQTPYDDTLSVDGACWVTFTPEPGTYPASDVLPGAQVMIRFSEPMDPQSVSAFDTMFAVKGSSANDPNAINTVVANIYRALDLKSFTLAPRLPMAHSGNSQAYHLMVINGVDGVTDLAGNPVAIDIPIVDFSIDPEADEVEGGGVALRFTGLDEYGPPPTGTADGNQDIRGQLYFDFENESIFPRGVIRTGHPIDPLVVPLVSTWNAPFHLVQVPLVPQGSRTMSVWRYCDMGFSIFDESTVNLDVEGLNWVPLGGQLLSDFFEEFEIRLSHSIRLPDEGQNTALPGVPGAPNSGLYTPPSTFERNIASTPSDSLVVHNRSLGYRVNPVDIFVASSGTQMTPYPLNRSGGPREDFIWRDTANQDVGGAQSAGIPLSSEVQLGLYPGVAEGSVAPPGQVPTIGLPLLMEFRVFPSNTAIGMNYLATGTYYTQFPPTPIYVPYSRVHSSGGINTLLQEVLKNPDLQDVADGGYNPLGTPILAADNTVYLGQLDTVVRVSRVHTVWFNTDITSPDYVLPIVEPSLDEQPIGTNVVLAYRGANSFQGTGSAQYNAFTMDEYGDLGTGNATFFNGDASWKDQIDEVDGAPYLQVRITFVNNINTFRSPRLSSLGVAFGTL